MNHQCDNCSKHFASRQSRWRHEQKCGKTFSVGDNLKIHEDLHCTNKNVGSGRAGLATSPEVHPSTLAANRAMKEMHRMQNEGKLTTLIPHIQSDNESDEGTDEDMDEEAESSDGDADIIADSDEDDYAWTLISMGKRGDDKDVLMHFTGLLLMYIQSKHDAVIRKIMKDAGTLEASGMKFGKALGASIIKNRKAIELKMSTCDIASGKENMELWATFVEKDTKFWCKWNTGRKCHCKDCPDECMLRSIGWRFYEFHFMDKDRLVQTIVKLIEDSDDIDNEAFKTVEKYRNDILESHDEAYDEAEDLSEEEHQDLVSMFKYIADNE